MTIGVPGSLPLGPSGRTPLIRTGHAREKQLQHPEVGVMELQCQVLRDPEQGRGLLVLTATPGTEDHAKLDLLSVIGTQSIAWER